MTRQEIITKAVPILQRNPFVLSCALFGSYATDNASNSSDIDFLVKLKRGTTLFDEASLQIELTEALEKEVDIVDAEMIHPLIRKNVIKERISFYER